MARNGSGTYSKINTFVAGNSITASGHNANWDDLATEMTNSVAADGQTTMTGPLKAASGTVSLPGLSFGSDTDCGVYRIGANNLGVAVNGAKVLDVATTGLSVTGIVAATGALKQGGFALLPVGAVFPFAGSAAPSGYLLCDGSSLLRASYPDLFTAIGTTYGAADGTHFTLPDLTGRTVAGKEASATRLTTAGGGIDGGTLGAVGGVQKATLAANQIPTLTSVNASQAISLGTFTNGGGAANVASVSGGGGVTEANTGTGGSAGPIRTGGNAWNVLTSVSGTASISVAYTNGSQADVKTVMPAIILNYIIFAGV